MSVSDREYNVRLEQAEEKRDIREAAAMDEPSTRRGTVTDTLEYTFCVEAIGWEMTFSIDYEVTPGELEDRRERGYSLGTPASDPECEINSAVLVRIESDVLDEMGKFWLSTIATRVVSKLFGRWFMAWIEADEDDRVKLHEACFVHARVPR